jgi:hypothetical protein
MLLRSGYLAAAAVALVLAAGVIVALAVGELRRARLRRLAEQRRREPHDPYVTAAGLAATLDVPVELARIAFAAVQEHIDLPEFPVRADDDLARVYGLDRENVEDLLTLAGMRAGCGGRVIDLLHHTPRIATVEDLVYLLAPLYAATHGRDRRVPATPARTAARPPARSGRAGRG